MKNILQILSLAIIGVFLAIDCSLAQSLELISYEATVQGVPEKTYKSHAEVKNISGTEKKVFVRVTPVKLTQGHSFYVCVPGTCLPEKTEAFDSPTFTMAADYTITEDDFYVAVNPIDPVFETETEGETILKVDFIISGKESDFITFNTTFQLKAASVIETWNRNSEIFPNPSTEYVIVRLKDVPTTESYLKVYDAAGNAIYNSSIQPSVNSVNINTATWNGGSYYFSIESNGNVINSGNFTVVR